MEDLKDLELGLSQAVNSLKKLCFSTVDKEQFVDFTGEHQEYINRILNFKKDNDSFRFIATYLIDEIYDLRDWLLTDYKIRKCVGLEGSCRRKIIPEILLDRLELIVFYANDKLKETPKILPHITCYKLETPEGQIWKGDMEYKELKANPKEEEAKIRAIVKDELAKSNHVFNTPNLDFINRLNENRINKLKSLVEKQINDKDAKEVEEELKDCIGYRKEWIRFF